MDMFIITDILFGLYIVNYFVKFRNCKFMLIHIGNLSKVCTLCCSDVNISHALCCSIISLRKGSASAFECHYSCTLIILYLQRYFKTCFDHTYVSFNWNTYLMFYIFINTYIMQKMITLIIIKNDGHK